MAVSRFVFVPVDELFLDRCFAERKFIFICCVPMEKEFIVQRTFYLITDGLDNDVDSPGRKHFFVTICLREKFFSETLKNRQ